MRLLDLFCGAGGAAEGYRRAGFTEIVGVDFVPQPNYPFMFLQMNAIDALKSMAYDEGRAFYQFARGFDLIHASPPCQKHSRLKKLGEARNGAYPEHVDHVAETRELLKVIGTPYVIENVEGAPLLDLIKLCGSMWPALRVYRHRLFECSFPVAQPVHRPHDDKTPSVGLGMSPKGFISVCGEGGVKGMKAPEILAYWRYAMGISWMKTRKELALAIPPAFTEYIGSQFVLSRLGDAAQPRLFAEVA